MHSSKADGTKAAPDDVAAISPTDARVRAAIAAITTKVKCLDALRGNSPRTCGRWRVADAEGHPAPNDIKERVSGHYARIGSRYRPSILDDLETGHCTEGEYTVGDLVRRADRYGLAVPILQAALYNLQVHEARVQHNRGRDPHIGS